MANYANLNSLLESTLGLNEFGIGQLRSVEWSRKYLWSVKFLDEHAPGSVFRNEPLKDNPTFAGSQVPDEPFGDFFPAADIDIDESTMRTRSEDGYYGPIEFPEDTDVKSMRLTFMDDQNNTLYKFFKDWINIRITGRRRYTLPITECLKQVEVRKLKLVSIGEFATGLAGDLGPGEPQGNGSIADIDQYWVFPRGAIQYNANSQSETHLYSVELVIAGNVQEDVGDGGFGDAATNIARVFGAGALTGGLGNIL